MLICFSEYSYLKWYNFYTKKTKLVGWFAGGWSGRSAGWLVTWSASDWLVGAWVDRPVSSSFGQPMIGWMSY